jgi:fatty acid desaturase
LLQGASQTIKAIATLDSVVTRAAGAPPYVELKRRVERAGLLKKRPAYYTLMLVTNLTAFVCCFAALGLVSGIAGTVLLAVALGLLSGQLGFQLHDAGHRQMFASRRLNTLISLITGDLLLGMSQGWWIDKHNRHHGNPNHVDLDPDIGIGVIAYSSEQALAKRGFERWIASHQAGLFFVLICGLGWAMHVSTVKFLMRSNSRMRLVEIGTLCLHVIGYVGMLVVLVGPWRALLVIVVQKSVGGFYLASVFAPNHKGMPQIEAGQEMDFLRSQVLTARNVRSHPLTDLLYGSLNYQIEHHLFPTLPRCNLRRAHAMVRDYCSEVDVPYYETSIVRSYREILSFLSEVSAPLRGSPAT